MKFIFIGITSLVIATPLSAITFPIYHAQIPKTIRDWARFDKLIGVNEQKTQVIPLQPEKSLFFLSLGNSHFGLGDYVEAMAYYTQALQLNPHSASAYYNRGEVRSKLGDKNGAIADLKKAVDIFQSQGEQDNYQDALNHLKKLQNSLKQPNHK